MNAVEWSRLVAVIEREKGKVFDEERTALWLASLGGFEERDVRRAVTEMLEEVPYRIELAHLRPRVVAIVRARRQIAETRARINEDRLLLPGAVSETVKQSRAQIREYLGRIGVSISRMKPNPFLKRSR